MRDLATERPRRQGGWTRWIGIVLFVVLVVVPLVTVAVVSTRLFQPGGRVLEVELQAKGGRWAQIFWSADFAMRPDDSSLAMLHQQPGSFDTLRFALPQKPLEVLRFDPLDGEGEVLIRRMRVLDDQGRTVRSIDPGVMLPLNQIASVKPDRDGVRIVTTPGANDPMLVMRSSWLVEPPRWYSLRFVTPFSLTWMATAVLVLISTGLAFILREIRAGPVGRRDLWFAALMLTVIWSKLALLQQYPVPVPFWDQWDGEALTLYIPWADDGVTWRQMFTFHNEHRIFFSRLLALTLRVTNGQWDPHLQIVVNAVLDSLAALVFAALLWLALGRRHLPGVVLAVVLTFAPPFAIENSLAGFQSAFYFLILFSGLALWLMGTSRPGTARWFLGCLFALCCPFTVAGGILVLPAIGGSIVLRAIAERWGWRPLAASAAALAVVAAVGYAALPPAIASHDVLKAGTLRDFEIALARSLAFPWINYPRAAVAMWLPLTVVGLCVLWRRLRTTTIEQVTLAIGAWVVVQCAAMAYTRGANGGAPTSRYLDMVALGYLANTTAFLSWLGPRTTRRASRAIAGVLVTWIAITGIGLARVSEEMLVTHGQLRRLWTREHVRNVRQFMITDDVQEFVSLKGPDEVPYYSAPILANWLEHPSIRRILPTAVRQPFDLRSEGASASGNTPVSSGVTGYPPPVFDSYAVADSRGEARFESQPINCRDLGRIRFEINSSTSWSGLRLSLKRVGSGEESRVVPPWFVPPGWFGVSVRCPEGSFTVVAVDASPTSWFAFRQPAEVALGSALAESVIQQSRLVGLAALALVLLALGSTVARWRSSAPTAEMATKSSLLADGLATVALGLMALGSTVGRWRLSTGTSEMAADSSLEDDGIAVPCAICGNPATHTLYIKEGYAIGRCRRCGLVYANPRAPEAKILFRYSADYFWKEYLPSLGVVDGTFDLTAFDKHHAAVLQMIAAEAPGRRLLEVGCGAGFFLKAAERAGWQVEGIELSPEASRFAVERLALPIRRERAEDAPIEPGSFDAAVMFDVIEHLFDPRAVLTAIARALAPGGTLVISTPNVDSLSRYLLGPAWAVLSPLEHIYYFNEDSLRRLLEASGYSDVRFVKEHVMWGPQQTVNFKYTHAPDGLRARVTEWMVDRGDESLARRLQRAGRQDSLLCFARRR
jgi:SAM-dependent methyltransferase